MFNSILLACGASKRSVCQLRINLKVENTDIGAICKQENVTNWVVAPLITVKSNSKKSRTDLFRLNDRKCCSLQILQSIENEMTY